MSKNFLTFNGSLKNLELGTPFAVGYLCITCYIENFDLNLSLKNLTMCLIKSRFTFVYMVWRIWT
jgi:hypothetical protein